MKSKKENDSYACNNFIKGGNMGDFFQITATTVTFL